MKFIKLFLLILTSINCLGQTTLDSLVFNQLNNYRKSKRVRSLDFDSKNFKAANHHSIYLSNSNKIVHTEDTLIYPIDRLKFYGGKSNHIGENILSFNLNVKNDSIDYIELSRLIINKWVDSSEHNIILLNSDFKLAGVSCILVYKSTLIKDWSNIKIVSTLLLTN
jgi:uncharacterized protein YkwD